MNVAAMDMDKQIIFVVDKASFGNLPKKGIAQSY